MSTSDESSAAPAADSDDQGIATPPPTDADPGAATVDLDQPEPPGKPQRDLRGLGLRIGALVLVVVLVAAGYVLVRYLVNVGSYHDGRAGYDRADCLAAVPHFDDVINSWRLVPVGDEVLRAQQDKAECQAFQVAVDRQRDGDDPGALAAYADFVHGRVASPLTQAARDRITALFTRPDVGPLATLDSCDQLGVLRGEKLVPTAGAAPFHAACGHTYLDANRKDDSIGTYVLLFRDFGQQDAATVAESEIVKERRWCVELHRFNDQPALAGRAELIPGLLSQCAKTLSATEGSRLAEEFLKRFSGHRLTAEVMGTFAARVNEEVRADTVSRPADEFVEQIGSAGGDKATLVLFNDGPGVLRLAFSGPEPRVEDLPSCPDCPTPPATERNPICSEKGPSRRITLAPGEYDLAQTLPYVHDIAGNYGHARLDAGKLYFTCWGEPPS
jgi:hypothetical protein